MYFWIFTFNNEFYLQIDGTAQDCHMYCFYSDIAMAVYNEQAMDCLFKPLIWKCSRDVVIALWIHSNEDADNYLMHYWYYCCTIDALFDTIDTSGKIRFTVQTENKNDLKFLGFRLKLKGCNKFTINVFSKPINSFAYVDPETCFPSEYINHNTWSYCSTTKTSGVARVPQV